MIVNFLITFRETLEAAIIIGIILAYLSKTKNTKYNNIVYIGLGFGIIGSIISALLFNSLTGGFSGRTEEIFEGVVMIIGSLLLSSMILWMMNQKHVTKELQEKISVNIDKNQRFGLFMLVFLSVLREGIETVIFLGSASLVTQDYGIVGAFSGIIVASFLGYLIFVTSIKVNVEKFFDASSLLLIFFAAGLMAHGVHEFQEAKILPIFVEHIWDINPATPLENQGIYPALHEKGAIGSIAKGLFGYNGNPNLLEVVTYLVYMVIIFLIYQKIELKKLKNY